MRTDAFIGELYPDLVRKKRRRGVRAVGRGKRPFSLAGWVWKVRGGLIPVAVGLAYVSLHIYCYNLLVGLRSDVDAAWAQVEAARQRRSHIQENLTKISMDYATHERQVLVALTELRSASEGPEPSRTSALPEADSPFAEGRGAEVGQLAGAEGPAAPAAPGAGEDPMAAAFSRLRLVAEQYPQLNLSENLSQFATAIIQIEAEIARLTMAYNQAVNRYGTALHTYPVCVIGRIMQFESREFYRPDPESMRFRRVEY